MFSIELRFNHVEAFFDIPGCETLIQLSGRAL